MSGPASFKVPKDLRDAVMKAARAEGLTATEYLRLVTEEHARRKRLDGVRQAYAGESRSHDRDYAAIARAWDEAVADGLDDG